jgi:dolichol kinase
MRAIEFENSVSTAPGAAATEGPSTRIVSIKEQVGARVEPLLGRLSARELRRRAWHMLPGFLPFLLWGTPHADPLSPTLQLIIVGICVGLGVAIFARYRSISRRTDGETVRSSCVLGYAGSIVAAVLLFPSAPEIAFAVLAILAFGDGSATLFGHLVRSRPLPWNPRKSWSGFLAFIAVALPMAALMYWGETHNPEAATPGVSFGLALLCVAFPVLAAAIAESVPSRWNDNIRVGVVALASMAIAQTVFVGW